MPFVLSRFRRRCAGLLLLACLASGGIAPAAADPIDPTPRTAVLCAFEPEWQALRAIATDMVEQDYKGVPIITGSIEGKPVVLAMTGVSMVNAAMTTQMTLERYNVTRIVVSGIAGGVDPALNIGDIAVPDRWGQYLEAIFARESDEGFSLRPGAVQDFPNYGMIFPRGVRVFREGQATNPRQFWFEVDPALMAVARKALAENPPELAHCTADNVCLTHPPQLRLGGQGVSGAAFVDNAAFRAYTFRSFKAQVLDMESAAIAQVATTNGVPFIVFRALSDLAGGGKGANEIRIFEGLASHNAVTVMRTFLRALPE
ncbi:5'-methylthioadenosine/S-adenosylhomocysteine nucleosidase [Ancylobacter sp. A5.8]|uniref:5'-methylthioadenosine/S-adenosylhomocysteine nucleosidase n=1 Tax=Ancylobacter gelatini TaxID=2919920 RepID=UPI001F4E928E|nr:5'-methylthioadenosine/S-adenosylhomocysteine nucleosidase [Ancylobacter gelatini]MCJ8143667.1 5'-methylthioadenosine/S-adenosylhomocysteine nucleosidase [Ancylobacter gelatini]